MVLWDKVFYEVAKEYEGQVEWDKMLVDAMTVRMVNKPESMDTIVATNRKQAFHLWTFSCNNNADDAIVHADILSDLAAALAGSIGIAPSSNLDPTRSCPSTYSDGLLSPRRRRK